MQQHLTARRHAQKIAKLLQDAEQECRIPSNRFGDPKAQELFELVAQELGRMVTMLEGYRTGNEPVGSSEQPAQPWGPLGTQPPRGPDIPIGVDDQVETPPRITSKEAQ